MNGTLALTRKDARLANGVLIVWITIMGLVVMLVGVAPAVPFIREAIWGPEWLTPSLSERLQAAAFVATFSCYLVPCGTAVAVALGDSAHRAQLLAAATPNPDWQKIASKLATIVVTGAMVFGVWLVLGAICADDMFHVRMWPMAAAMVVLGALSGLATTCITRRGVPALLLATALPLIGAFFVWCVQGGMREVMALSGLDETSSRTAAAALEPWRRWGPLVGVTCFLMITAVPAIGELNGRAVKRRRFMLLSLAASVTIFVLGVWAAGSAIFDRGLVFEREQERTSLQLHNSVRNASDDRLMAWARGAQSDHPSEMAFLGRLSSSMPPISSILAEVASMQGIPGANPWYSHQLLKREISFRALNRGGNMRTLLSAYMQDPDATPMQRLRVADYAPFPEREIFISQVLAETKSEAVHMAALALLASEDHLPTTVRPDWCQVTEGARSAIHRALKASPALAESERAALQRGLESANRPHPAVADLLAQSGGWAGNRELECIRNGEPVR